MNKTEFLKKAMTKFKADNDQVLSGATTYKPEMNFIFSKDLILRVFISIDGGKAEFCHRWCTVEPIEDKQELIDQCLEVIKKDVADGDLTAIDELLSFVPEKYLKGFLPEKL